MAEGTYDAATAKRARDEKTDPATHQKLKSQVVIFTGSGANVEVEDDGEFDLDIDRGGIKGKHTHPLTGLTDVTGTLVNDRITIDSADGIFKHIGVLYGRRFVGIRKPGGDAFDQEEGVWVGTKVP